jgi:hypothetical protein
MKRILKEKYTKRNNTFIDIMVEESFISLPKDWYNIPTIELMETLNKYFSRKGFILEMSPDETGVWKWGEVDIQMAYLDNRHSIHLYIGNDFIEKNIDDTSELIKTLKIIWAHENTHKDQFVKNPHMITGTDENYFNDEYEIDAHAREAAEELIQVGITKDNFNQHIKDVKGMGIDSKSFYSYWNEFGRWANEDSTCRKVWSKFLKRLYEYMFEE